MPVLDWIGKDKVVNHHNEVPYQVLEPKYTYGETDSGNMIIHGDNLAALKSLLPQYEGRIKCIYIDPPYNTGNEGWVYNDNVNDPRIKAWLGNVVGAESEDLSRHDKWLCMLYARLKLLHRLLSEDGVIFISIDDNELINLSFICNEIFGINNYVDKITVIVKPEGRRYGFFAKTHEYLLVYAKKKDLLHMNEIEIEGKEYSYYDNEGGFNLTGLRNRNVRAFNSTNRPNLRYPFYVDTNNPDENGLYRVSVYPIDGYEEVWASTVEGLESVWRWGKDTADRDINKLCAYRGNDGEIRIFQKDRKLTEIAKTVWIDKKFSSIVGTREIKEIFGKATFDFPKPYTLIQQIIEIASDQESIILDSFAGSGTTAHAVLNMNKKDGGNRKFILIEMEDYADSITAERVKRVIDGYGEGKKAVEGTGGGFTFYELGEKLMNGEYLNENVGLDKIREYIYFTETKQTADSKTDEPHYLGTFIDTAYYFYYDKENATTLDRDFLHTIKTKAAHYVIYADKCILSDTELEKYNITFKKIPRDITRL